MARILMNPSWQYSRIFVLFLLAISLLAGGCGGDDDGGVAPESTVPPDLAADLEDVSAVHTTADDLLTTLLTANPDTAAALASLAATLADDPLVATCQVTEQGLAIRHASGLVSAFVLDFADRPELTEDLVWKVPGVGEEGELEADRRAQRGLVTNPRTGLINPHHHEREIFASWLLERYDTYFPRIDFHQPERYFDAEATVEKFTSLDGYGVLHLYSHGVVLGEDLIGLMTGEAVNENTSARFATSLTEGTLAVIHPRGQPDLYAVLPEFVTGYNDFSADSTLVWGGFCYSGLGGWPQALIADGARGYFGFDWSVYTVKNVSWASSAMNWLTDNSGLPRTVQSWFAEPPVGLSYWDPGDERTVSCQYWGDPQATLWEIAADYDPLDITDVQIHLAGLELEQVWNDPDECGQPYDFGIYGYVNRGFWITGSTTNLSYSAVFQDSDTNYGTVSVGFDPALTEADSLVIHEFKIYEGLGYTDELRLKFYDLPLVAVDNWPGGNVRVRFETDCQDSWPEISVRRERHDSDCTAETQSFWLDTDAEVLLWFVIPAEGAEALQR